MSLRIDIPAPPALDKAHLDLKKATQQFEGYFLHQLLTEMRKTVPDDKLLADDGNSKQIFQDMMDQTLADQMSSRGDLGLANMMYDLVGPTLGHTSLGHTSLGKTTDRKK